MGVPLLARRVCNRCRSATDGLLQPGEGGRGGPASNVKPAALVIPAAEARARSRQAGRARALWARAHRLWVGTGCLQPRLSPFSWQKYTPVETQKTAEGHVLVVYDLSLNEHPRNAFYYVKLLTSSR